MPRKPPGRPPGEPPRGRSWWRGGRRGAGRRLAGAPHARGRGGVGEDLAADWLAGHGYRVLARNVVNHAGEIDVVARDGDTLCFVEVKARSGRSHGTAAEAVTPHKQRRLTRAAALWLATEGLDDVPCRFDVLALDRRDGEVRVTLLRGAFEARW